MKWPFRRLTMFSKQETNLDAFRKAWDTIMLRKEPTGDPYQLFCQEFGLTALADRRKVNKKTPGETHCTTCNGHIPADSDVGICDECNNLKSFGWL